MYANRKLTYKLPPTTITDSFISQQARRAKALENQKRRRALRIDSSRQLDQFADLNLGESDDDDAETAQVQPSSTSAITHAAVLQQATMDASSADVEAHSQRKKHRKKKRNKNKPTKWANKCMYAELLEMAADVPWTECTGDLEFSDGLPSDLESKWVAVPVPAGKRCLAVTHQASGIAGVVPNTTLRSRLLGKALIQRFPSALPPLTILDCILDANWRDNGILHVLDVIKWKGQDIGDCEAAFRFWWRDTRLTELLQSGLSVMRVSQSQTDSQTSSRFPYPITLLPIPYHTNTTYATLYNQIIPVARSVRSVAINVPVVFRTGNVADPESSEGRMDVDKIVPPLVMELPSMSISAQVEPDGLLLYVAEASYEVGTSPLSSWIPISSPTEAGVEPRSPLDHFQRLVHGRLLHQNLHRLHGGEVIDIEM